MPLSVSDLQGRVPMHPGRGPGLTSRRLGQRGGVEQVTLTEAQMPNHTHSMTGETEAGESLNPSNNSLARSGGALSYQQNTSANLVALSSQALPSAGGSQPHNNLQPFIAMNFIIALVGLYPSRG